MSHGSKKLPPPNSSSMTTFGLSLSAPFCIRFSDLLLRLCVGISLLFGLKCHEFSIIETEVKATQLRPHYEGMNAPAKWFRPRDCACNDQLLRVVSAFAIDSKRRA